MRSHIQFRTDMKRKINRVMDNHPETDDCRDASMMLRMTDAGTMIVISCVQDMTPAELWDLLMPKDFDRTMTSLRRHLILFMFDERRPTEGLQIGNNLLKTAKENLEPLVQEVIHDRRAKQIKTNQPGETHE